MWIWENLKYALIGFVLFNLFLYFLFGIVRNQREKAKLEEREKNLEQFQKEKAYYEDYFDKSPEELSGMPGDVEIGADGYPKDKGALDWGENYTFFYTPNGQAYHRKKNCSAYGLIPIHAWGIYHSSRYPCSKCHPQLPDLTWFSRYKQILSIMNKYNITPKPYLGPSNDFLRMQKAEHEVSALRKEIQKATDKLKYYESFNLEKEAEKRATDIVRTRTDAILHNGLFQGTFVSLDFQQSIKLEANDKLMRAQAERAEIIPPLFVRAYIQGSRPEPYEVTLENCNCIDFIRNQRPCKHMYRLALEMGLLLSIKKDDIDSGLSRLAQEHKQNQKELAKLKAARGKQ